MLSVLCLFIVCGTLSRYVFWDFFVLGVSKSKIEWLMWLVYDPVSA